MEEKNDMGVFSMTSFHGCNFFPGGIRLGLDNPITVLAALEAVVGLVIEVSLILHLLSASSENNHQIKQGNVQEITLFHFPKIIFIDFLEISVYN